MKPLRREKVSAFLRNELAKIIQLELGDPRIGFVSVLSVEPTDDLKEAKVRVSILGTPSQQRTAMRGLEAARGYMQTLLGERSSFRNTPLLSFIMDESIEKSMNIDALIQRARGQDENAAVEHSQQTDDDVEVESEEEE